MNKNNSAVTAHTKDIFEKALHEVAWTHQTPQIIGGIYTRMVPDRDRLLVSETYTELRKRLEQEETAPPPPPESQPLEKLELDTGGIIFGGGVPVGGYSHLSVFANGAFSFSGHFHDSGTPPYDVALVWVLKSSTGTAFTLSHKGLVHGTFDAGSRSDDWGDAGTNPALAAAWADISAGYTWAWNAGADLDLEPVLDSALKVVGAVATVIKLV